MLPPLNRPHPKLGRPKLGGMMVTLKLYDRWVSEGPSRNSFRKTISQHAAIVARRSKGRAILLNTKRHILDHGSVMKKNANTTILDGQQRKSEIAMSPTSIPPHQPGTHAYILRALMLRKGKAIANSIWKRHMVGFTLDRKAMGGRRLAIPTIQSRLVYHSRTYPQSFPVVMPRVRMTVMP